MIGTKVKHKKHLMYDMYKRKTSCYSLFKRDEGMRTQI